MSQGESVGEEFACRPERFFERQTRNLESHYFCWVGGAAGACDGAGCVFTGWDLIPCNTEDGPLRLLA